MIIRLDKHVDCGMLCHKIQQLINKNATNSSWKDKVISIRIVDLIDGGDKHIPKLEYKE